MGSMFISDDKWGKKSEIGNALLSPLVVALFNQQLFLAPTFTLPPNRILPRPFEFSLQANPW
jgi:hypothetical protein